MPNPHTGAWPVFDAGTAQLRKCVFGSVHATVHELVPLDADRKLFEALEEAQLTGTAGDLSRIEEVPRMHELRGVYAAHRVLVVKELRCVRVAGALDSVPSRDGRRCG
jgi:hypothetical protein